MEYYLDVKVISGGRRGDPPRAAGLPAGQRASAPRVLRQRARAGRDPETTRAGRARWLLVQRPRHGTPPRRRGGFPARAQGTSRPARDRARRLGGSAAGRRVPRAIRRRVPRDAPLLQPRPEREPARIPRAQPRLASRPPAAAALTSRSIPALALWPGRRGGWLLPGALAWGRRGWLRPVDPDWRGAGYGRGRGRSRADCRWRAGDHRRRHGQSAAGRGRADG